MGAHKARNGIARVKTFTRITNAYKITYAPHACIEIRFRFRPVAEIPRDSAAVYDKSDRRFSLKNIRLRDVFASSRATSTRDGYEMHRIRYGLRGRAARQSIHHDAYHNRTIMEACVTNMACGDGRRPSARDSIFGFGASGCFFLFSFFFIETLDTTIFVSTIV